MAVLAQRLVRTICQNCKEAYQANEEELEEIGLTLKDVQVLYRGRGCEVCQHTGYRGRLGIFELMVINDDIRASIMNNSDSATLKVKAREHGMRTLREDGALKVIAGIRPWRKLPESRARTKRLWYRVIAWPFMNTLALIKKGRASRA